MGKINWQKFLNKPARNILRTSNNIQNITTEQGNHYITQLVVDHNYFKNYYKMIATDLSKQQTPDTDPKAMEQINFTGNLEWEGNANAALFFIFFF